MEEAFTSSGVGSSSGGERQVQAGGRRSPRTSLPTCGHVRPGGDDPSAASVRCPRLWCRARRALLTPTKTPKTTKTKTTKPSSCTEGKVQKASRPRRSPYSWLLTCPGPVGKTRGEGTPKGVKQKRLKGDKNKMASPRESCAPSTSRGSVQENVAGENVKPNEMAVEVIDEMGREEKVDAVQIKDNDDEGTSKVVSLPGDTGDGEDVHTEIGLPAQCGEGTGQGVLSGGTEITKLHEKVDEGTLQRTSDPHESVHGLEPDVQTTGESVLDKLETVQVSEASVLDKAETVQGRETSVQDKATEQVRETVVLDTSETVQSRDAAVLDKAETVQVSKGSVLDIADTVQTRETSVLTECLGHPLETIPEDCAEETAEDIPEPDENGPEQIALICGVSPQDEQENCNIQCNQSVTRGSDETADGDVSETSLFTEIMTVIADNAAAVQVHDVTGGASAIQDTQDEPVLVPQDAVGCSQCAGGIPQVPAPDDEAVSGPDKHPEFLPPPTESTRLGCAPNPNTGGPGPQDVAGQQEEHVYCNIPVHVETAAGTGNTDHGCTPQEGFQGSAAGVGGVSSAHGWDSTLQEEIQGPEGHIETDAREDSNGHGCDRILQEEIQGPEGHIKTGSRGDSSGHGCTPQEEIQGHEGRIETCSGEDSSGHGFDSALQELVQGRRETAAEGESSGHKWDSALLEEVQSPSAGPSAQDEGSKQAVYRSEVVCQVWAGYPQVPTVKVYFVDSDYSPTQERFSDRDLEEESDDYVDISEITPHQGKEVVTPQKLGGVYIYDQPNHGYQDYDVPPSRYFPATTTVVGGGGQNGASGRLSGDGAPCALYDTPGAVRAARHAQHGGDQDVYDVPPSSHAHIPIGALSPSNRSSVTSLGSTTTVSSGTSSGGGGGRWAPGCGGSNPASTCGSARSSTEVQDIYDVPPPAKAFTPKSPLAVKHTSGDSGCPQLAAANILIEDYDSPHKGKAGATYRDTDSGIVASAKDDCTYDVPPVFFGQTGHCNKLEHDIDNIYDHPTNNAPTVPWAQQHQQLQQQQQQQGRVQGLTVAGGVQDGSVYDIPPQVTRDSAISMGSLMDEVSSRLSSCSVASSGGSSDVAPIPYDELPLDLDAALELLVKLQQEVHSATSRLLSFVHSGWRQQQELEPKLYNIKLGCLGVQATLQEFVDFGQGALANSAKADDKKLVKKLLQLLEPLQDSLKTVNKGMRQLNELNWSISELVSTAPHPTDGDSLGAIVTQAKEVPGTVRIMASCIQGNSTLLFKRQVDGQSTTSANSSPKKVPPPVRPKPPVLPKPKVGGVVPVPPTVPGAEVNLERRTSMQDRPLPAPPVRTDQLSPVNGREDDNLAVYEVPHGDDEQDAQAKDPNNKYNNKGDFLEDYDYVHLENRPPPAADSTSGVDGSVEDETDSGIVVGNDSGGSGLTSKFQERLQQVQQGGGGSNTGVQDNNNVSKGGPVLHPNDRQLLSFYAGQIGAHTAQMVNSIDAFFQCIEFSQPPKVFIAHSKSVVMAAHRMVYVCDTIHRNLLHDEVRVKVMACANYLCDCLKLVVTATKAAALQYPSVVTVQEMVDRVVDVSHAANEIKLVITQAAIL